MKGDFRPIPGRGRPELAYGPGEQDNKQHDHSMYSVHVCVGNSLVICKSPLASVREDPSCS